MKKTILAFILLLSGVLGAHAAANTPTFTPTQSLTPTFYPGSLAQRQDIMDLKNTLKSGIPAVPLTNTPTGTSTITPTPTNTMNGTQIVQTSTATLTPTSTKWGQYIQPTDTATATPTNTFNSTLLTNSPTPIPTSTFTPFVRGGRVIVPGDYPTPFSAMMIPPTTTPSIIPTPLVLPVLSPGMCYKIELQANNGAGTTPVTLTTNSPLATKNYYFGIGDIRAIPLLFMSGPITFSTNAHGLNINWDSAIVKVNP